MTIILLLAGLAIAGVVATIVELHRDGYHAVRTDPRRAAEAGAARIRRASAAPVGGVTPNRLS